MSGSVFIPHGHRLSCRMISGYFFYQLEAKSPFNAFSTSKCRTGVLIRYSTEDGGIGYADCHPWPELGDLPVEDQVIQLMKGRLTPLLARAVVFAEQDAAARQQKRALLESSVIPESHFLIDNLLFCSEDYLEVIISEGFTHVKVKVGRDPHAEARHLLELFSSLPLNIRLDFNEALTESQFIHFLEEIAPLKDKIDFIEDPFPFDIEKWASFQRQGWTLACDREVLDACGYSSAAAVIIIKPAIHGPDLYLVETSQRKIVTSNVGHPLEQVAAASVAALIDPFCKERHGILSHRIYRPNQFSSQLNWHGPHFILPEGTGYGFDEQLSALQWEF